MTLDSVQIADLLDWWKKDSGTLSRRLANGLRRLIEEGFLINGSQLPPERKLADALSVSRNTVAWAYAALRDEGWIESRQGSGTRITTARISEAAVHRADGVMATLLRGLGTSTIDLTVAAPVAAPIVSRAFDDPSSLSISPGALTAGHGYYAAGHPHLRSVVAEHLSARGLPTNTSQIMITNGAQQSLALLVGELIRPGTDIAIEEVCYPGLVDLARRSGARTHFLPVGGDGVDLAALEAARHTGRIGAVFLVPSFQNPTGTVMPIAARRLLVEMASEEDFIVVDDRTQADLDHGQVAPPALGSFDHQSRVVTVGALSKLYWGGLRVGWIRARSSLIDRLTERKSSNDLGSSMPVQVIAAELLAHHYDATQRWRNDELRRSLDALELALMTFMPGAEWVRPLGGPNLWIRLPDTDALEFSRQALKQGVAVIAGPLLSGRPGRAMDRIRIPFFADPVTITEAVTRLASSWSTMN